jgi:hypothetical protein
MRSSSSQGCLISRSQSMLVSVQKIACKTARELLIQLQEMCFQSPFYEHRTGVTEVRWIFRGQAAANWGLTPSAYRGSEQDAASQVAIERSRYVSFLANCDEAGLETSEYSPDVIAAIEDGEHQALETTARFRFDQDESWPRRKDLHNLALAQHNGLATRLLDWSKDPYVASYFAASSVAEHIARGRSISARRMSVWALDTRMIWHLRDAMGGSAAVRLVFAANSRNRRLFAQRGCFTLIHCNHIPKGGIKSITLQKVLAKQLSNLRAMTKKFDRSHPQAKAVETLIEEAKSTPVLRHFTLPHREAANLLKLLSARGIGAAALYADLEGAVKSVAEQEFWQI